MTRLTKPVRRKVVTRRGAALVVTLTAEGIWIREARRRFAVIADYGELYLQLVRAHVDAEKRAKKVARKARRAAR